MEINYKKAFEKLAEQIKLESKWAKDEYKKEHPEGLNLPTRKSMKGCTDHQLWIAMGIFGQERFDKGMMTAYGNLEGLVKKLEDGTFFEEDNPNIGYEDQMDKEYESDVVRDMFV